MHLVLNPVRETMLNSKPSKALYWGRAQLPSEGRTGSALSQFRRLYPLGFAVRTINRD